MLQIKLQIKEEQTVMAKAFIAMVEHADYLSESTEIMDGFNAPIHHEKEEWWKKK